MKKIKIISSTVISLFSILSFGQDIPFKIQKSDIFKDEIKKSEIIISENDGNGGVLLVRSYDGNGISPNTGYYFEHYDSNLKLIKDFELESNAPLYQKYKTILGHFFTDNKIFIADIHYDLKVKEFVCSMTIVDFNDFKATKKELFRVTKEEIKKLGYFELDPSYKYSVHDKFFMKNKSFGMKMSLNNNKTAFSILMDINSEDTETLKLFMFDNKLNKKFDKVYKRDIKDNKFQFQNFEISNDGNTIYLLGKVILDEKKDRDSKTKYVYELTKITKDFDRTKVIDIREHYVESLKTFVQEEKLITIGFYSDEKEKRYKGICYFELNLENLELKTKKIHPFTEEFIIEKYGRLKQKELKNLIFKGIEVLDNKEIVFNAEEMYYYDNENNTSLGSNNTQRAYAFNDIVSIKLDDKGNMLWAKNINKTQMEKVEFIQFISYSSRIIKNDVCFFINADEEIKNLKNNRIEFRDSNKNKYNLYLIRVNENGVLSYQKILSDEENEVPFMVGNGINSGNSIFFLGRKGKKKQLLKVSF